ncbi:MAG: hypothetical protein M1832_003343 [Thelocarpon impressellum]|nr:MAG: hypothetical protein M1832_003343 [Thelocarpon impressellum]
MSGSWTGDGRSLPDQRYRPARNDHDGSMYDDRVSPPDSRNRHDVRHRRSPSPRRRSPPQDGRSRTPPRGPAPGSIHPDAGRDWDARRGHGRDDRRRGRSLSPQQRAYRDRDREGYRSPTRDDGTRSGSRPRHRSRSPYYGGVPSRDVIMEGLPVDLKEDDISKDFAQKYNLQGLEDVRVIRDRQTGVSRKFGFLRFSTIAGAKVFLEQAYPLLSIKYCPAAPGPSPADDQAANVRVSFCRERGEKTDTPEDGWKCPMCSFPNYARRSECRQCQASRDDTLAASSVSLPGGLTAFKNTGDSDVSPNTSPSQFLLFRGLEPTVTEELLAKGAAKLYKASGGSSEQNVAAKKPVAKVASTTGDSNLGAKEGSLKRVLLVKDRRTGESWRYGFAEFASVDKDAQAALTKFNALDKFTISSKQVMLSFIHAGVFVPAYNYSPDMEAFTFSPLNNPSMKLVYWDEQAYVDELTLAAEVVRSTKEERRAAAVTAAETEGLVTGKESEGKSKKRKAEAGTPAGNKKAGPAHLSFWRHRHAELHGIETTEPPPSREPEEKKVKATPTKATSKQEHRSFADTVRKCCLLCSRQFKSDAEVAKHEAASQLHRTNLQKPELVAQARVKLAKASADASKAEAAEYRDRASERRKAFGQPKRPAAAPEAAPAAADEPVTKPANKGAALLGKMGWSAGSGLGADGSGTTAPIQTDMYVQGVGLGAQGGKVGDATAEAERNTKGDYAGWVERGKEGARERFERLG